MNPSEYANMYQVEDTHWWYAGMREIMSVLLNKCGVGSGDWPILDAGCGTGGMIDYLRSYGAVTGVDIAEEAISFCQERGHTRLTRASIMALPFGDACFRLVTCFDVLYHLQVKDDLAVLGELGRVLEAGGWLLLRVPAFDWLRGAHDLTVHTRHRYTARELREKLTNAGFVIDRLTYANTFLFPFAVAKRIFEMAVRLQAGSDVGETSPLINQALKSILSLEARLLSRADLPFGLSVICLAHKNHCRPDSRG